MRRDPVRVDHSTALLEEPLPYLAPVVAGDVESGETDDEVDMKVILALAAVAAVAMFA